MSRSIRGGLVAAGLIAAFAAGLLVKNFAHFASAEPQTVTHKTAKRTTVAATAGPHAVTVPKMTVEGPAIAYRPKADVPPVPIIDFSKVDPPAPTAAPDENDPAFQVIKKQMGIRTTVRGDPHPLLPVLAETKGNAPPAMKEPDPMIGPSPRLDPPPSIVIGPPPPSPEPPAPQVKYVNSRAIALDFEMTRTGSSKVAAVELWTTRDGGKSWEKADRMDGCQSPFRTRLGSEGDYGFKLVFESENGIRSAAPKPGQAAELHLELDTTPPKVTLLGLAPAEGTPGAVSVQWAMTDDHLDPTATCLEFSPDGEFWHRIDTGAPLPTRLGYEVQWTPPAASPPKILLRVTARDRAGNVATAQTPTGVLVDLVAPNGKLTGVRTEKNGPEVGPMPRLVSQRSIEKLLIPVVGQSTDQRVVLGLISRIAVLQVLRSSLDLRMRSFHSFHRVIHCNETDPSRARRSPKLAN